MKRLLRYFARRIRIRSVQKKIAELHHRAEVLDELLRKAREQDIPKAVARYN